MQKHARYVFHLEELFECHHNTNLLLLLCSWLNFMNLWNKQPLLTFHFHVSKLQKQLRSVTPIHLDQSANFGSLPRNASVTVSHNVAFNNIYHWKWPKIQQIQTSTISKDRNKPSATISSKYHANTRKVCFPFGRFVSMSPMYEFMTNFCVTWVKIMNL